jgi:AmiR/NasT family two-component response regulator
MDKRSMSESEAHRYLQKLSMASGQPLAGIARNIINELQKD